MTTAPRPEKLTHWRISVEANGVLLIAIESDGHLAGCVMSQQDEEIVRTCAKHLSAFLGDTTAPAIEALAASEPGEKPFWAAGAWYPTDILGNPMREFAQDQWESAMWPSAPPATPVAAQVSEAVARVDANDDGFFAEILPDRSVTLGQLLYDRRAQPQQVGEEAIAALVRFVQAQKPLPADIQKIMSENLHDYLD